MNDNTIETKTKVCSKCQNTLLADENNFNKNKKSKDGLQAWCKSCKKNRFKEYRIENLEKIKENNKIYREQNHKKLTEKNRIYRENNKELIKERKNQEKIKKYNKEYRKKKREIRAIQKQRRYALQADLFSSYNLEMWNECKEYFDNSCAYCGNKGKMTQEHFIPISKGGDYSKNNIIPACGRCNSSKRDTDFMIWYRQQKFYNQSRQEKIYKYLRYDTNSQQLALL